MSADTAFSIHIATVLADPTFLTNHPALEPLWAASLAALRVKLHKAPATKHTLPSNPGTYIILPTMLPLPAHHGLPLGQIFNPSMTVADFKIALDLMDFTTIPAWLDHPLVDMWFSHFSGPTHV
jgi:hypothetical protein